MWSLYQLGFDSILQGNRYLVGSQEVVDWVLIEETGMALTAKLRDCSTYNV